MLNTSPFGLHLTLDLYGCSKESLSNMKLCYDTIIKCVEELGMNMLMPPFVIDVKSNTQKGGKDPGGFSCFVMIVESHISIHTFVNRGYATIDVYSCKPFNEEKATKLFENAFKSKETEKNLISRGLKYPMEDIY